MYKLDTSFATLIILLILLSFPVGAQVGEETELVEEIIVTGSYIKRNKFDMASPVETISNEEIQTSGYASVGPYVRDLTYTANVDTVANVLGGSDGQQDSNSARFNLRGLGTSSTLTLFDGRRVLNDEAVGSILPDIATERVEVILDGGAATYGTDAVAGVVNLIPMKAYEGFKLRGFYSVDAEGDIPEPKVALLWGAALNDRTNVVAAVEYAQREDALYRSDRPKFLAADNDTSISGNPGSFSVYRTQGFGGIDSQCGNTAFNGDNLDDSQTGSYPGGFNATVFCTFEYGQFQDYKRPNEDRKLYFSTTFQATDYVELQALIAHDKRQSKIVTSPSTAERSSNNTLPIYTGVDDPLTPGVDESQFARHPAFNTAFGTSNTIRSPRGWRPFTYNGATQPSHLDERGANQRVFTYETTSVSLGSEFTLGDTSWVGETWYTNAQTSTRIEGHELSRSRLRLALQGNGGPDGNQWFNPFGSASELSPAYVGCEVGTATGCTANSQELVDWLYSPHDYKSLQRDYWSLEGFITGDLFDMPAGPTLGAIGMQFRETSFETGNSPLQNVNDSYDTSIYAGSDSSLTSSGDSAVSSIFVETDIPLLSNLNLNFAARYEDFKDLDLNATVPKVSFRYQPVATLALRATWGKGFLAPTLSDVTVDATPTCGELFAGSDPMTYGTLIGTLSCTNGNPQLDPEDSELWNIGATWEINNDLEVSLDYQQIAYVDRIVTLGTTDVINVDLANMLDFSGLTLAQYDAIARPPTGANPNPTYDAPAAAAIRAAWYASGLNNPDIVREAGTEQALSVTRTPFNVAEVEVDVIDFRVQYGVDLSDLGYLSTSWSTTAYTKYEYLDAFATRADGRGKQNAQTNLAPPLPKMKHQLRLNWLLNNHNLGLVLNHQDAIDFDDTAGPAFGPDPVNASEIPDEIDAQTLVDLRYSYQIEEFLGGGLNLAIGSNNLFDKEPQVLPILGGLETRLQDPTGRTYYIEGTYDF